MAKDGGGDSPVLAKFSHTSHSTYCTALFALFCIGYDSTHDVIERSHINKKWFYLFGATCLFAYLYVRPLIRRRLGSASRGYINYSTIYISWLLVSVFYHLPSLESMGINIKADVSMWLACFLGSLAALGTLHAAYALAVALRLLRPRLHSPTAGARQAWSIVLLNSVNLAVACSVYYSFCGNAPRGPAPPHAGGLKEAVCRKWLHPVSASSHSAFTRWVIYGEAAANRTAAVNGGPAPPATRLWGGAPPPRVPAAAAASFIQVDFPLDGKGLLPVPADDLVSPIFTMWVTLLLMYAANCLADYAAAATLRAAYTADMRRELAGRQRSLRRHQRRRSADYAHDLRAAAPWGSWVGGGGGEGGAAPAVRDALSSLAARGSFDALLRTMSSVGHLLNSPTSTVRRARSVLFRDDSGVGRAGWAFLGQAQGEPGEAGDAPGCGGGGAPAEARVPIPPASPQPSFMPMFPWYSGTSADLLNTSLDLLISVRLFLGRFDARTLQAATSPRPSGPGAPASGGDGFTYEHLAGREEVWWDFVADTGDGGHPTYAIARCLAAPQLSVEVPAELVAAGTAGCPPEARAAALLGAGRRTLPRACLVVHGGDLCYPTPSDECFEQRLAGPYHAAFPPPAHAHPGHLVVDKPDLGPQHWAAAAQSGCAGQCGCGGGGGCSRHSGRSEAERPCRRCAKEAALRGYEGPTLFAVPGNHDYLDGLASFQKNILARGWLGGWLMPQEKSYFALHLPHGWWVFGFDLALEDDIDMCQYSYFARLAEERVGPEDQVVLVQHCPNWLVGWFWGRSQGHNLRQLVRGPLRGRARVQLAGDLHFMMRHSFRQYGPGQSPSLAPSELATPAGGSPLGSSPLGGSPSSSRRTSRSATPAPGMHRQLSPTQLHQSLVNRLGSGCGDGGRGAQPATPQVAMRRAPSGALCPGGASPRAASPPPGAGPPPAWSLQGASPPGAAAALNGGAELLGWPDAAGTGGGGGGHPATAASKLAAGQHVPPPAQPCHKGAGSAASLQAGAGAGDPPSGLPPLPNGWQSLGASPGGSPPSHGGVTPFASWWPGLRVRTSNPQADAAGGGGEAAAAAAYARLADGCAPPGPPSAWQLSDPEHLVVCGGGGGFCHPTHVFCEARFRPDHHPAAGPAFIPAHRAAAAGQPGGGSLRGHPSSSSLGSLGAQRGWEAAAAAPPGGEYRCEQAFPTPQQSVRLGRGNLTFRSVNNRFDVVGGLIYYLLVISVLPRCSGVGEVLEAHTLVEAAAAFGRAGLAAAAAIFSDSYVSLATLLALFAGFLGLCRSGGIGAIPGVPHLLRRRPELHGSPLAVRARLGGLATQVAYAGAHCLAHLSAALSLLLLLELGIEVMAKHEGVGRDGYNSLYKWYRGFEAQHFPDPMGLRDLLHRCSLGLYPTALKWAMALFDVPEAIAVGRAAMCAAGGSAGVSRLQAAGYYLGVLAYYWLLATPAVGFLFGAYLYISVNWFHCHYDEAFSSLQVPHFKGFLRLHITRGGDLELFGLALERVPHSWREDPRWRTPHGGGNRDAPAHRARFPSRWVPVEERGHLLRPPRMAAPPEAQLQVVDYLLVPRRRAPR